MRLEHLFIEELFAQLFEALPKIPPPPLPYLFAKAKTIAKQGREEQNASSS